MLDPIQYEFLFLFTTLADTEPDQGAGAETSIFRLQPKVPAPCDYSSTTLLKYIIIYYKYVIYVLKMMGDRQEKVRFRIVYIFCLVDRKKKKGAPYTLQAATQT
jgi:hypothetical protein